MADFDRDIGRHDEAIVTLKADVHAMRSDLADIKETLDQHKGGIRMLLSVGAIGGAAGAALMKFVTTIKGG